MCFKKLTKNILNIILNIFCGWFTYKWFIYAYLFITDRKDAEAEDFVPVGYIMLIIGLIATLCFRIYQLINRENKKSYWIYNILPFILTLAIMIIGFVIVELGYENLFYYDLL